MSADEMMAHRRLGESLERARRAIESLGVRSPNVPAPAIPEGAPTCPDCGGVGWYAAPDRKGNPEQVQCERCYAGAAPSEATPEPPHKDLTERHFAFLESEVARLTRDIEWATEERDAWKKVANSAMLDVAAYREVVERVWQENEGGNLSSWWLRETLAPFRGVP